MFDPHSPAAALATTTALAPRALVDDPRALDDAQLVEVLRATERRALVLGVTMGALAVAMTAAVSESAGLGPVAAWAMIPAFVVAFVAAVTAQKAQVATQLGVTRRCIDDAQRAHLRANARRDIRTISAREILRPVDRLLVARVRAELERATRP